MLLGLLLRLREPFVQFFRVRLSPLFGALFVLVVVWDVQAHKDAWAKETNNITDCISHTSIPNIIHIHRSSIISINISMRMIVNQWHIVAQHRHDQLICISSYDLTKQLMCFDPFYSVFGTTLSI